MQAVKGNNRLLKLNTNFSTLGTASWLNLERENRTEEIIQSNAEHHQPCASAEGR